MGRKSYELREAGRPANRELVGALLKLIAVGAAGGAVLIGGAAKAGEFIAGKLEGAAGRLDARRETYKEEARRIEAAEAGAFIDGEITKEEENEEEGE